jgi:hypothetical protein
LVGCAFCDLVVVENTVTATMTECIVAILAASVLWIWAKISINSSLGQA